MQPQTHTPDDEAALWNQIAPHLDPALAELAEPDRDAVLLRFFERKTAREIGQRLGISEEAAQKRVHRAVDRLRSIFVSRGLAVPSASLTGVLTVHAVQAAPAALASSVTAIAVTGVAAGTAGVTGTGILTIMASTQLKTGVAVLLAAGAVTIGLLQQREIEQVVSSSPLEPAQFEVLFKGSMAEFSNPSQAIILRERSVHPRRDGQPGFTRCYGFGDGHSEMRTSSDGNFDAWEQEHQPILKPAPAGGAAP